MSVKVPLVLGLLLFYDIYTFGQTLGPAICTWYDINRNAFHWTYLHMAATGPLMLYYPLFSGVFLLVFLNIIIEKRKVIQEARGNQQESSIFHSISINASTLLFNVRYCCFIIK